MEKNRKTDPNIRRNKTISRPLTSEEIIRQANALLNLKQKEPAISALEYRNFLQAQKDLLAETQESLLPRRQTLNKKQSITKPNFGTLLRHTPVQLTKPQLPTRSADFKLFEESKLGGIENFNIGKLIGTGAYASVKTATLKAEGRKFALKIYEKYRLADPSKKRNVEREIEILKKLNHPYVVQMFDVIETPKQLHLVLEYISGGSLGAY